MGGQWPPADAYFPGPEGDNNAEYKQKSSDVIAKGGAAQGLKQKEGHNLKKKVQVLLSNKTGKKKNGVKVGHNGVVKNHKGGPCRKLGLKDIQTGGMGRKERNTAASEGHVRRKRPYGIRALPKAVLRADNISYCRNDEKCRYENHDDNFSEPRQKVKEKN